VGYSDATSFPNHRQPRLLDHGQQAQVTAAQMGSFYPYWHCQHLCLLHLDHGSHAISYPKNDPLEQNLGAD
jgi:hypothetical protein